MITELFYSSREELFDALAASCTSQLLDGLNENKRATFMVSGGSSPSPLYQRLSGVDLDWANVDVALVDERWVNADHAGSNEALVKKTLLQNFAQAANFTPMKNEQLSPTQGLSECEQGYQRLQAPFDVVILGMGPDGHTASLFPESEGLERALGLEEENICAAITAHKSAVTGELVERMTLSLYGLCQSKALCLLLLGEDKLQVYRRTLANPNAYLTPVSAILMQTAVPVSVYWAP